MFDATLPSDQPPRVTVAGRAELSWKSTPRGTRLDRVHNTDPLRFLFPRREQGQPETAVLVTTSGGLVGGDRLDLEIGTGPGASGLAMTQAAEKIYGSGGPETVIQAEFNAAEGSWLEWLPHETILFDGARLTRRTRLNLAGGARVIAGEILVFGRLASGETMTAGTIRESWEVRTDGRLVWADVFRIDGEWTDVIAGPAGLAGMRAMATIVCATGDAASQRDAARVALEPHEADGLRAGATTIAGLTVVRILAERPAALRAALAGTWGALRSAGGNYGAALPRLWHM